MYFIPSLMSNNTTATLLILGRSFSFVVSFHIVPAEKRYVKASKYIDTLNPTESNTIQPTAVPAKTLNNAEHETREFAASRRRSSIIFGIIENFAGEKKQVKIPIKKITG